MKRSSIDHPKVDRLAAALNIERFAAVGLLETLWHFTAKRAPQGDIGKFTDAEIAKAVGWQRPSGARGVTPECKLSDALVSTKWLDRCDCHRLVVHDWPDHADQSVTKMLDRQRLSFVHPADILPLPLPLCKPTVVQWMDTPENGEHPSPLPVQTPRHLPRKDQPLTIDDNFERIWDRHPKKKNRTLAEQAFVKHYQAELFTLEAFELCHAAWCETEDWNWKGGAKAPMLAEWIDDGGYKYYPPKNAERVQREEKPGHMHPGLITN